MSEPFLRQLDPAAHMPAAPGERFTQLLVRDGDATRLRTVAFIRTPPGEGSRNGMHTHEFDQCYVVLEGAMTFHLETRTEVAEGGCLYLIPAGVPHRNVNEGDVDTVSVMIESREIPDWKGAHE